MKGFCENCSDPLDFVKGRCIWIGRAAVVSEGQRSMAVSITDGIICSSSSSSSSSNYTSNLRLHL